WITGAADTLTQALAFNVTFENLAGTAPTFTNASYVGDANQSFEFHSFGSSAFSGDLSFTSLTLTTTYSPRSGPGPLTYHPAATSFFAVAYDHVGVIPDPGPFVSLVPVPEPPSWPLLAIGIVFAPLMIPIRRLAAVRFARAMLGVFPAIARKAVPVA